jgi:hypothetical protein
MTTLSASVNVYSGFGLGTVYGSVTESADTVCQFKVRSHIHGAIYDPVCDSVTGSVYWHIIFTVNGIIKSYGAT